MISQKVLKFPYTKVPVCDVYYSDDWNKWGFGLLGQNSFLTRFDALFNRKDKEFSLIFRE